MQYAEESTGRLRASHAKELPDIRNRRRAKSGWRFDGRHPNSRQCQTPVFQNAMVPSLCLLGMGEASDAGLATRKG